MDFIIDILKNNMEDMIIAALCLICGFGGGCMVTETIWRMKDEEDIHKGTTVAGGKESKDRKNGRTDG